MREEKVKLIFYDENFKSCFICTQELSYKHHHTHKKKKKKHKKTQKKKKKKKKKNP